MGIFDLDIVSKLFLDLFKISILSGLGILVILVISPLLGKKHTVFWRYLLWVVLAVRLALPFDFSLPDQAVRIPVPERLAAEGLEHALDHPDQSVSSIDRQEDYKKSSSYDFLKESPAKKDSAAEAEEGWTKYMQPAPVGEAERTEEKRFSVDFILRAAAFLWAAAVIALAVWQFLCYGIFWRRVEKTKVFLMKDQIPVYCSSAVFAPVLAGLLKPEILLPCQKYDKEQLNFILEHEITHYKRKDLWMKLLLAAVRTIHWFNPFVAVMAKQAEKDMELLCDSRVVRNFTREEKKRYSEALLACAASRSRRMPLLCTSEFSRDAKSLKERFSNIFSGGKKKKGILAAAFGIGILLFVSLFVAFGTSGEETLGNGEDALTTEEDVSKRGGSASAADTGSLETEEKEAILEEKRSKLFGLSLEEAAEAVYGAVFPKLIYASEDRAVLYDYWGLLVYNIKDKKIEQLLDLKAADLAYIQGEKVTHVEVSDDGAQILLYNEPNTAERFIYDIDKKQLSYSELSSFKENHFDGLSADGEKNYIRTKSGKTVYLSVDSLRTEDGDIFHETDLCGLSLLVGENNRGDTEIYPLFLEYYEKQKETAVPHLTRADIRRFAGKEFLYADEEGWNYYLEEDVKKESPLWEEAAASEPLLLVRYKGEERQILEDLIYQEAWQNTPILFADGRIVYQAAKTADIVSIKAGTLVSIATDGSDRQTADEIMYHTFDGLCEDNGWIYYSGWTNDGAFPKPLCRIAPDFSGSPQVVEEIPGLLCGVVDNYVFYLAAEGKTPGIWKRNLSTGEEEIHDKWGVSAEEMSFFNAREDGDLGCHIILQYGYEDGVRTCDIPLYVGNGRF